MAVDQKKKQAIILDLEMNPVPKETASASGTTREVIEIGAVRVRDNKLADRFHTFVRPSFSKTITPENVVEIFKNRGSCSGTKY